MIRATFGVEKFDFNTKFVGKSKSLSEVVPKVLVVSKRLGQAPLLRTVLIGRVGNPCGSTEKGLDGFSV